MLFPSAFITSLPLAPATHLPNAHPLRRTCPSHPNMMLAPNKPSITPTSAQQKISASLQTAIKSGLVSDGSPVALFYDLDLLRANATSLRAAFPPTALHAFALKAAPLVALVRFLHENGLGGECASVAELAVCARAGLPGEKVIFDSPAKTDATLRRAMLAGVHVNADSLEEVERIGMLIRKEGLAEGDVSVGLRVNPQLGNASIAETFTASRACKFGEGLKERRQKIVEAFLRNGFLSTVHVHVGSQGCEMDVLVAGARAAAELADEVNGVVEGRVQCIDIGGGLSVEYWGDGVVTRFEELGERLRREVPGLFKYRIMTEFGRRVASNTGFIAARVESVKRSGGKTYVVCHAGADLLMRTVYQREKWGHRVEVYDKEGELKGGERVVVDVAGPICFAGDIIAVERKVVMPERGDYIVVRDAGAYTISMYCRHTSQLVPPVWGYEKDRPGEFRLLKKGETEDDVVRFWDVE